MGCGYSCRLPATSGVAYNANGTVAQQLEQIMLQKYYAYLFVNYQSWFEKRRTGYPVLPEEPVFL